MDEMNEQNTMSGISDAAEPQRDSIPSNTKRKRYTIEKKLEIMKEVKRFVALGLSYSEMTEQLEKKGYKVSTGSLFKYVLRAKDDILSTEEAARIWLERMEKKKMLAREAMKLLGEYKEERKSERKEIAERGRGTPKFTIKDEMVILKQVCDIERELDDFLSRANLLAAVPSRTELEVKPKLTTKELVDYLKEQDAIERGENK